MGSLWDVVVQSLQLRSSSLSSEALGKMLAFSEPHQALDSFCGQ